MRQENNMAEELFPIQESDYNELLLQTVAVIEHVRIKVTRHIAATASNTYWEIGKLLYEKKLESGHGSGVVKRLSVDLKKRYPDMGLSPRQLWNMKSYYIRYMDCDEKLLRSVALLPWSQNLLLLSRDLSDVDTKIGKFIPEYAGKMNYYLSLLDRTERQEGENPSVGIILCAERDHLDVELALEGTTKPIGVADYQFIIPKEELQKTIAAEIQSFEEEYVGGKTDDGQGEKL